MSSLRVQTILHYGYGNVSCLYLLLLNQTMFSSAIWEHYAGIFWT